MITTKDVEVCLHDILAEHRISVFKYWPMIEIANTDIRIMVIDGKIELRTSPYSDRIQLTDLFELQQYIIDNVLPTEI